MATKHYLCAKCRACPGILSLPLSLDFLACRSQVKDSFPHAQWLDQDGTNDSSSKEAEKKTLYAANSRPVGEISNSCTYWCEFFILKVSFLNFWGS